MKQILINIGDGAGIRIDPRVAGKHPRKSGPARAGNADADARLEDAVAFGHPAELLVELRAVERMGHRADELPGCVARKLGVTVKRDDIPDIAELVDRADDFIECSKI